MEFRRVLFRSPQRNPWGQEGEHCKDCVCERGCLCVGVWLCGKITMWVYVFSFTVVCVYGCVSLCVVCVCIYVLVCMFERVCLSVRYAVCVCVCVTLPVPQNSPEFSSQTSLHQHVQVLAVFKGPVQPGKDRKFKSRITTTSRKSNLHGQVGSAICSDGGF